MNKKDAQLINSIFEKLKYYKRKAISIEKKDLEDFFNSLINKN